MKVLNVIIFSLLTSPLLHAEGFNLKDRIDTQKFVLKNHDNLFGKSEYRLAREFKKTVNKLSEEKQKKVTKFVNNLSEVVATRFLMPLTYWLIISPEIEKAKSVLKYAFLYRAMILRDVIDNPLSPEVSRKRAGELLDELIGTDNTSNVFAKLEARYNKVYDDVNLGNIFKKVKKVSRLDAEIQSLSTYSLSTFGLIPGNKVELISENESSLERIDWYNDHVIFAGGKLDFDAPHIKMPTKEDPTGHPAFVGDPIFMKIREMIDSAKDSIFIDIFLFGGTLGATLSEYLLDQTLIKLKENPNFKVLMLHDYATNYNMITEMMPIFSYIKERINGDSRLKNNFFLLQANIQRHTPGIPFGITDLIPKTKETFKFMEKRNVYYESKIDHSKVIVVDANSENPRAYFGSKNWSDHSGGYYYDDAIFVEGPVAALVQSSYVDDIKAALTTDKQEQDWFFFKEDGFDNKRYLGMTGEIVDSFTIKRKIYPLLGTESVRIAEANVDGKVKNVRNIIVDMIVKAKSHIYLEQLFIYDKYINDALIKRKKQIPEIDIRIIADHNGNFKLGGLPNNIFIKELKAHGVKVKGRKLFGVVAKFPNGEEQEYHQENHRKLISVDGKSLVGGSSNLNPDTLQGSFREFGAQIFDKASIKKFEDRFVVAWDDPLQTEEIDIENFQIPLKGASLSKRFSAMINGLLSTLIRSKDYLEMR